MCALSAVLRLRVLADGAGTPDPNPQTFGRLNLCFANLICLILHLSKLVILEEPHYSINNMFIIHISSTFTIRMFITIAVEESA